MSVILYLPYLKVPFLILFMLPGPHDQATRRHLEGEPLTLLTSRGVDRWIHSSAKTLEVF